jgi:exopolysaccharide biosynthesis polyprenyl glycosylphosphotransferase
MKRSEIAFGITRIPVDFLMTLAAFLLAYHVRTFTDLIPGIQLELDLTQFPPLNEYINFSATAALLLIAIFAVNGMYSLKSSVKISRETGRVFVLAAAWIMIIIAYFFVIREFPFSRLVLGYSWIFSIIFISIGRIGIHFIQNLFLKNGIGRRRILFIGYTNVALELAKHFRKDSHFTILGYIDSNNPGDYSSLKYLGTIKDLKNITEKENVEEVVQTRSDISKAHAEDILDFCRENHIQYHFVPDLVQVQRTNIDISSPSGIPLISLKPTPLDGWGKVVKRIFDIIGATIGLVIFSPVFLVTAVAIRLDSKGNIFFKYLDDGSRVKRVGQYGEMFNFYKFRSMHPNTHNLRYTKLSEFNIRKGTPMVKIDNDPRVTRVGKFIRKWSIDELPQLWNVLKGDMSLVGPRPHLPEEVAAYKKHHKFALSLKPGITGLSQISGRSNLDFEKEIQLDTYYIENWSIWLDIKIIFKTFYVVLFNKYAENV